MRGLWWWLWLTVIQGGRDDVNRLSESIQHRPYVGLVLAGRACPRRGDVPADTLLDHLQDRIADLARAHLGQLDAEHTTLALFGSVARGSSTLDSDIDIVAVFPDNINAHTIEQLVDAVTAGVQRWTGNSCNVYDVTSTRLAQLIEASDPMIESWAADARTFLGPDLRRRLLES